MFFIVFPLFASGDGWPIRFIVSCSAVEIRDAWDFEEVYGALFDFAKRYPFDPDNEDYWIQITTGTHVVQICLFLMTEARFFPGRLVQTSPPRSPATGTPGSYALIDLDLWRYDQIAQRFSREQVEGEARARFMHFARSPVALWSGNFRDLWASVTRMATLAQSGRITEAIVDDGVVRLLRLWRPYAGRAHEETVALEGFIGAEAASRLDPFDAVQLEAVIRVCLRSKNPSDAGHALYGVSREAKSKPNDADRLKKYLARFDLDWEQVATLAG